MRFEPGVGAAVTFLWPGRSMTVSLGLFGPYISTRRMCLERTLLDIEKPVSDKLIADFARSIS